MVKKTKHKTWTVAEIAKAIGVSKATVYNAVRRERRRKADPLAPLFKLAERNDVSPGVATVVINAFRLAGLPKLGDMAEPKQFNHRTMEQERLASLILNSNRPDVNKAIAEAEKLRTTALSGVSTRMSKTRVQRR